MISTQNFALKKVCLRIAADSANSAYAAHGANAAHDANAAHVANAASPCCQCFQRCNMALTLCLICTSKWLPPFLPLIALKTRIFRLFLMFMLPLSRADILKDLDRARAGTVTQPGSKTRT